MGGKKETGGYGASTMLRREAERGFRLDYGGKKEVNLAAWGENINAGTTGEKPL